MNRAKKFAEEYAFQTRLIQKHVDSVTDSESLLQLPFNANCMNWILGHIIARRQSSLDALGADPLWDDASIRLYRTGSDPINSENQAIKFSTLLDDLEQSMDLLQAALQNAAPDLLDRLVINDRGEKTAAGHLEGFLWHETYHIGQLDILQAFIRSHRDK
jgi:hypothetical protein